MVLNYSYMLDVALRIILAVILGGIIGLERENKNRPAGFRTHILVCVGASLTSILSEFIFIQYHTKYGVTIDPTRIGAQVISGIGFLGAGTIIHAGANVRGLTTAASLWTIAIIGLVVGAGFYFIAIFAFVTTAIVLIIFGKYAHKFNEKNKRLEMLISIIHDSKSIGRITMFFGERNLEILEVKFISIKGKKIENTDNYISVVKVVVLLDKSFSDYHDILKNLSEIKGIVGIERI